MKELFLKYWNMCCHPIIKSDTPGVIYFIRDEQIDRRLKLNNILNKKSNLIFAHIDPLNIYFVIDPTGRFFIQERKVWSIFEEKFGPGIDLKNIQKFMNNDIKKIEITNFRCWCGELKFKLYDKKINIFL